MKSCMNAKMKHICERRGHQPYESTKVSLQYDFQVLNSQGYITQLLESYHSEYISKVFKKMTMYSSLCSLTAVTKVLML